MKKARCLWAIAFRGSRVVSAKELFPLDLKQIACRQTVAAATNEGRS